MLAKAKTITFKGLKTIPVDVEVHMASGLPAFLIVGLPDKAVAESKERVRSALQFIGISFPPKRITVNLAPADLYKEGSHFDLPIALAMLSCMGIISQEYLDEYIIAGELSLDGSINAISGVLPIAMHAFASDRGIICPKANGGEATWAGDLKILASPDLKSLIKHCKGEHYLPHPELPKYHNNNELKLDMAEIKGQSLAKRALEIAAAGRHNVLMFGPPGAGKSMLAKRMNTIMPDMTAKEILETSSISSISGLISDGCLSNKRPFRSPHHSCSAAAMVGGGMGNKVKPGEISLAHNGVLFLDELPEFSRVVLDSLRQPMESAEVLISRSQLHVNFPANFQLIAAMNPCPCGYLDDVNRSCSKAPKCSETYLAKISGPIMDRIDIYIKVQNMSLKEINDNQEKSETSEIIKKRVVEAFDMQRERYKDMPINYNSELDGELLNEWVELNIAAKNLIEAATEKLSLSMRGYTRVLRIARTIADLSGNDSKVINEQIIAEAINYRKL